MDEIMKAELELIRQMYDTNVDLNIEVTKDENESIQVPLASLGEEFGHVKRYPDGTIIIS